MLLGLLLCSISYLRASDLSFISLKEQHLVSHRPRTRNRVRRQIQLVPGAALLQRCAQQTTSKKIHLRSYSSLQGQWTLWYCYCQAGEETVLSQRRHRHDPKSPHKTNQTQFHLVQGVLTAKGLEVRGVSGPQQEDLVRTATRFPAFSKEPSPAW